MIASIVSEPMCDGETFVCSSDPHVKKQHTPTHVVVISASNMFLRCCTPRFNANCAAGRLHWRHMCAKTLSSVFDKVRATCFCALLQVVMIPDPAVTTEPRGLTTTRENIGNFCSPWAQRGSCCCDAAAMEQAEALCA